MVVVDVEGFQRWAIGNLADNRNRGIFAEWMVGQALDCIKTKAETRRRARGEVRLESRAEVDCRATSHMCGRDGVQFGRWSRGEGGIRPCPRSGQYA